MSLKLLKKLFLDPQFAKKKAFLASLEIFRQLNGRELGQLANALHSRTYREGETVFLEGDIGRALFILESGRIELTRAGADGRPVPLYTLKPGEFFGEMALLEQLPRTATAKAGERSHLYLLYRNKLDDLVYAYPRIGACIMRHMAQLLSARLRRATKAAAEHAVPAPQPQPADA